VYSVYATHQSCGIAMPDSYTEPVGQVDFPGKLKITRHKHFLLQVRSILDHSILTFNLAK
jgi:hypothetical protein